MSVMKREKKLERRPPLTTAQKQLMLMTLLRDKQLFTLALKQLKPKHFAREEDRGYAIIWAAATEFFENHNDLPDDDYLCAEVESRIEGTDLTQDEVEELDDFIARTYDKDPKTLKADAARRYLKQLLEEYVQREAQELLLGDEVAESLPALLERVAVEAAEVQSIESGPLPLPFPDKLEEVKAITKISTGIPMFDSYMNGGHANKEVIGFCGPYSSCKTLLAVMLAVERAKQLRNDWINAGKVGHPKMVYLCAWEASDIELMHRAMSYAARIPRSTVELGHYRENFSTSEHLKPYEQRMFKKRIKAGDVVPGEWERAELWKERLNTNLRFIDFSGARPALRANATKLVPGMVATIESDQAYYNNPGVGLIIADYAGAAVKRAIEANGWDHDRTLRHHVGEFPIHCKSKLATAYDCPVWVFHQLGTEANARAPGSAPKMTDTAEAKNFFENVDFGFMVGVPTQEANIATLTARKLRRAGRKPDMVIKIDGSMSRVYSVDEQYVISGGGIVEKSTFNKVVEDVPKKTRKGSVQEAGDLFKDV